MEIKELPLSHIQNCRFAANRYEGIKLLPRPAVIAEVGVLAGDFSEWILENLSPQALHLIDIFDCDDYPHKARFKRKDNEAFVRNRFSHASTVQMKKGLSWRVLAEYPDLFFDWIYIDAGHDYKSVSRDLVVSAKKVKPNGFLVVNDYIIYDHLANLNYGVVQATNEFCLEQGWEFSYFAFHPELFCDVALRRIQRG